MREEHEGSSELIDRAVVSLEAAVERCRLQTCRASLESVNHAEAASVEESMLKLE